MAFRKQKPIPKESSFKEFSENQAKDSRRNRSNDRRSSGVSSKIKKMFNDRSEKRAGGRKPEAGSSDRRGSRDSGARKTFSGKFDSKDSGRNDKRGSRDSRFKFSDRGDSRRTDSRTGRRKSNSKRPVGKHDRRTSRGKSFKEDRRESRGQRGQKNKEMYDAICQKCNKPCKVPFKPTQGKGVSCSDCFEAKARNNDSQYGKKTGYLKSGEEPRKRWSDVPHSMRGAERRARDGVKQRGFTKPRDNGQRFAETKSGRKELFDAVCMKCGAKCKVPFKPTGKMGVSCANCYDKNKSPFKSGKKKAGAKTHGQKINDSNRKKFGKKRY